MVKKVIYLSDFPSISLSGLLDYLAELRNPELLRSLKKESTKYMDFALQGVLGDGWKECITNPKVQEEIKLRRYELGIPSEIQRRHRDISFVGLRYITEPLYPDIYFDSSNIPFSSKLTNLILDYAYQKHSYFLNILVKQGIYTEHGMPLFTTYKDLFSRSTEAREYVISTYLEEPWIDKVEIVSKKENLENLRKWIPEVMI